MTDTIDSKKIKSLFLQIVVFFSLLCMLFPSFAYLSDQNEKNLNYPKTIVLMNEYIDGNPQIDNTAATQIEAEFIEQKFDIIDKHQIDKLNERDVELNSKEMRKPIVGGTVTTKLSTDYQTNQTTQETSGTIYSFKDPDKIAKLARGVGAEVLVLGEVVCIFKEASQPYGLNAYTYEARVNVKAISTDNARVLAVDTIKGIGRDNTRVSAADKAVQEALSSSVSPFVAKIAEAWNNKDRSETKIELICDNATFKKSKDIRNVILSIKGVKYARERSFINNTLELDVGLVKGSEYFADSLSELSNPKIEIISKTAGRIYIKFLQ